MITNKPENRGGKNRNQGRKPLATGKKSVTTTFRTASLEQKQKFQRLGGGAWIRKLIDEA